VAAEFDGGDRAGGVPGEVGDDPWVAGAGGGGEDVAGFEVGDGAGAVGVQPVQSWSPNELGCLIFRELGEPPRRGRVDALCGGGSEFGVQDSYGGAGAGQLVLLGEHSADQGAGFGDPGRGRGQRPLHLLKLRGQRQ